jgi:hypothetical protein
MSIQLQNTADQLASLMMKWLNFLMTLFSMMSTDAYESYGLLFLYGTQPKPLHLNSLMSSFFVCQSASQVPFIKLIGVFDFGKKKLKS